MMKVDDTPAVYGFYRYTDIVFNYHKTIEDRDEASAFKSFLHHSALGDCAHPLRKDKERGLGLYIGMLPSGQARLMFSSTQFEYMRYLLHALGLTKELLPLPSSDFFLTESSLRNVSTVYLKTPAEVKKAHIMVQKNCRKSKSDAALISYRNVFDKVRDLYASKKGTWMAIDIEAWTVIRGTITEFGWSYHRWNDDVKLEGHGHFIVKKNRGLRNGKYVADAQAKYAYGTSMELETVDFKQEIGDLIARLQKQGPLFLVFHDCSQDIEFLKNAKYFDDGLTDSFVFSLPDEVPDEGIFVIDTAELFGALEGDARQKRSLGDMCQLLKIESKWLHNAGNDAHYTLLALKSMASGNQVDAQREERWPNQTMASAEMGSSLKVVHIPEDEDSDFSETEDDQ